jgi:hypothetical protein
MRLKWLKKKVPYLGATYTLLFGFESLYRKNTNKKIALEKKD